MGDRGSGTERAVKGRWVQRRGYRANGEEGCVGVEERTGGGGSVLTRGKSTHGCRSYAAKSCSRYFN